MNQNNRKRRVGIVTPPDVRYLTRTPSPKRPRNERDNFCSGANGYDGDGEDVTGNSMETEASDSEFLETEVTNVTGLRNDSEGDGKKIFNDSIHGHIELHPLFVKIVDTPQFQRLRNIKQLGGCYFVFPGASHHRFEHSIGTCYLAGKLVKSLQKRQPNLGITDEDMLCVQIAGLCHDLGHGPFSHMFDTVFIPTVRPNSDWKHETASVNMFDHMVEVNNLWPSFVKYNLTQEDMIFIKELIAGKKTHGDDCQEWPYKGRGPEKSYLYEIVANKRTGIDVDKFDYFSRDCHCLGISNSFDHKRYMKFARVLRVKGKLQICVRDKEAGNIYDMFHTRNSLFRRAYQHKTSNIIEAMISEAFVKADSSFLLQGSDGTIVDLPAAESLLAPWKMVSISESIDDMVAYSQLTDHLFYQILYSTDPGLEEARSILRRIQTRDLYKCIGQTILRSHRDKEDIPEIREEIARCNENEAPINPDDFVVDLINFDYGMRDRNPIDEVRFYQKDKMDEPMVVRKEEVSNMLPQRFAEQHMRVYFRKTDAKSLEKAKSCFLRWCQGKQCTTPKGGDTLAELTPMKPYQEVTHGNLKGRLSFS